MGKPAQVTDENSKDDPLQSKKIFTRIPTLFILFGSMLSIIILIVLVRELPHSGSVLSGTSIATASNVRLDTLTTERIPAEESTPLIDNCGGSGSATRSLTRGRETAVSIELGTTIDIEASLVEVAKSSIQTRLSVTEGETISSDDSVDVVVAPQSRVQYEVQWYETWQVGTLVFENTTIAIPYRVRVGYDADIVGSQNQACPDTTALSLIPTVVAQTPTVAESELIRRIPTQTSTQTSIVPTKSPTPPNDPSTSPISRNGFVDFECPSGLGFNMVYIKSTTFIMGSDIGPSNERPIHEVTVDDFCIDVFEVTNTQYTRCVNDGVCTAPQRLSSRTVNDYYESAIHGRFPVVNVTWEQAQAYCEYRGGRLPTESEWELVARYDPESELVRTFPWGRQVADTSKANYEASIFGDTVEGGQHPSGISPFGVHDLSGNVAEWVIDWFGPYRSTDIDNPVGSYEGTARVVRGGSFDSNAEEIRGGYRDSQSPDVISDQIGFRCVIQ